MIADSAAKSAGNRQTAYPNSIAWHGASQLSAATAPKPPIATTDLAVSIGALILTVAFGVVAAAVGLFSPAFLDYCPPESCALAVVLGGVGYAMAVGA